jgi:hypothetical protein
MSTWVIISWVFVFVLTGVNIFIFLKLKNASEQMLKMAFPQAKNMNEAMAQMQKMMGGMGRGGMPNFGGMKNANTDAQLQQAMAMLKNMKK